MFPIKQQGRNAIGAWSGMEMELPVKNGKYGQTEPAKADTKEDQAKLAELLNDVDELARRLNISPKEAFFKVVSNPTVPTTASDVPSFTAGAESFPWTHPGKKGEPLPINWGKPGSKIDTTKIGDLEFEKWLAHLKTSLLVNGAFGDKSKPDEVAQSVARGYSELQPAIQLGYNYTQGKLPQSQRNGARPLDLGDEMEIDNERYRDYIKKKGEVSQRNLFVDKINAGVEASNNEIDAMFARRKDYTDEEKLELLQQGDGVPIPGGTKSGKMEKLPEPEADYFKFKKNSMTLQPVKDPAPAGAGATKIEVGWYEKDPNSQGHTYRKHEKATSRAPQDALEDPLAITNSPTAGSSTGKVSVAEFAQTLGTKNIEDFVGGKWDNGVVPKRFYLPIFGVTKGKDGSPVVLPERKEGKQTIAKSIETYIAAKAAARVLGGYTLVNLIAADSQSPNGYKFSVDPAIIQYTNGDPNDEISIAGANGTTTKIKRGDIRDRIKGVYNELVGEVYSWAQETGNYKVLKSAVEDKWPKKDRVTNETPESVTDKLLGNIATLIILSAMGKSVPGFGVNGK